MDLAADHCARLVRERSYERYLAALFAPAALRPHLLAIYAFDEELSRVPDAVTEPLAGEIRLQWWRDVIEGRADGAAGNPVARAVQAAIAGYELPLDLFHAAIDARGFELSGEPMADRERLEAYLDATAGSTMGLAVRLLSPASAPAIAPAVLSAARAAGLVRLLRNLPRHAFGGQVYLPADRLDLHGGLPADVLRGEATPAVRQVIAELAERIGELVAAQKGQRIPGAAMPAFLEAAPVSAYRRELGRPRYEPFRRPLDIGRLRSLWLIWRAAQRGTIWSS